MRIICTAKIAGTTVGHIDHALAYANGFQQLGHEVYLMDQVGSGRCRDASGRRIPFEAWDGRVHFETVARSYGLWSRSCLIYRRGQATHGMRFADAVRVATESDLLIARSGQIHRVPEIFEAARCRAFFDGNPGNTQVRYHQGDPEFASLDDYHHLFTLGLNIGGANCSIPTSERAWHPNLRPVVLPAWPARVDPPSERFTTISTWKGRATFDWQGLASGEKSDNWLSVLDLPGRTSQGFEIALRFDSVEQRSDRALFESHGWHLADPGQMLTVDHYRDYIARSRAEFSVAHNRYVEFATGWFSDRSALYLASGRPVLVQSTGIEDHLPTGEGLLTFTTIEEAVAGVAEINGNYSAHCRAAREIAEAYFDSDKVLKSVLERIGL